ncbi:MAG TPA: thiolase family protein [Bacteroidota bacterium]|nr:thiolase family protein [Bacteroidota bacterium]
MARTEAYIVEAVRTPIGKYGGALREVRPDDLSASVMKEAVRKSGIDPALIDDILWGCANQAGEDNRNVARIAALLAGMPDSVPATTLNRLCGSGMDAVHFAARGIWAGDYRAVLAGGVESMSRAPYSVPKNQNGAYGNMTAFDTALGWRYPNPALQQRIPLESMGETAENVAEKYSVSRKSQDAFACESHRRAVGARERFRREILPVEIPRKKGAPAVVDTDEGPREDTSEERLAALPPVFRKGGSVTAGNSSSLNDGAAALLIVGEEVLGSMKFQPLARIVATGTAGVDPRFMGMGPVPASAMALKKAGLTIGDIDLVELNEAFAAQALAVIAQLKADPSAVNVNGGAIALGHPLGCSGARILTTLVREMGRRTSRYGLATMCIGVGQGIATVIENVHRQK